MTRRATQWLTRLKSARLRSWQRSWPARRTDAFVLLLIGLCFVLFFGWVWRSNRFIVGGDAFVESYPLRTLFWSSFRRGAWLRWLPYIFSGYPASSMAQTAVGYPLTWGYLFLTGYRAEQVFVLAPFLLTPIFTYAYARTIGRSPVAALLAGLSFGYGGLFLNAAGVVAMATNSFMWLPLVLIACERVRRHRLVPCLLWAGAAYAMSVLAGHGQSFLFVGLVAVLYGAFMSAPLTLQRAAWRARVDWRSWQPLLVVMGGIALAAGVAAFQILETQRAVRRSIRSSLSFETFTEGSFPPLVAFKSLLAPLYYYRDVTPYLAPLVLALALLTLAQALRDPERDRRIFFWAALAVVAWVLMLGENTPLYRLVYHLPFINQFRLPSRHCFEWTFAVSILAAYGWDGLRRRYVATANDEQKRRRGLTALGIGALCAAAIVGWLWWRATALPVPTPNISVGTGLPVRAYLLWKILFVVLTCVALRGVGRLSAQGWRKGLLALTIALLCLVEPYIVVTRCWAKFAKTAARFQTPGAATRFLQQFPPEQNRVYTCVNLFVEEQTNAPRLDPPNLTALYGLHNVGGYQSLILERYSRALGNVRNDAVNPRVGFPRDETLFTGQSHVLDLLNTAYVVGFNGLATAPTEAVSQQGLEFAATDFNLTIAPHQTETLVAHGARGDVLALVTSMAFGENVPQGTTVAAIHIHCTDGRTVERNLRAGIDTAEWAHERPDVRAVVPHKLAPVFSTQAGDARASFQAYRYWSMLQLDEPLKVDRIELTNLTPRVALALSKATLYDTGTDRSVELTTDTQQLTVPVDPAHWQPVYRANDTLILHNLRALPRAWLVGAAEAVDGEEALKRIRGESMHEFDPRRTALLEVRPEQLPALPNAPLSDNAAAHVAYQTNGLTIETQAQTPALLVVSEMNYPGWVATVDGARTEIYVTDYLLRSVFVPAGAHRVAMRYTAPALRNGAIISALTLLLMLTLACYSYGRRRKPVA